LPPEAILSALVQFCNRGNRWISHLDFGVDPNRAASAAYQISGTVAVRPPSLPALNCRFLILRQLDSADRHHRRPESLLIDISLQVNPHPLPSFLHQSHFVEFWPKPPSRFI
jgi:hypothetical protein